MRSPARSAVWLAGLLGAATLALGPLPVHAAAPKAKAAPGAAKGPANTAATGGSNSSGDATLGQAKADSERCIECHGEQGQGLQHANGPEGKFAKLAGQSAPYLLKQLDDFRSGARKHDVMAVMARSLDAADARDIAAYFAAQPAMRGDGQGQSPAAQRLFTEGDAGRGLPACVSCHGDAQRAPASALHPRIAGQEYRYLAQQLQDWRSGWRRNSPGGVMGPIASKLSEAEIDALALYLAGLP